MNEMIDKEHRATAFKKRDYSKEFCVMENKMNKPVDVICYGQREHFETRQ